MINEKKPLHYMLMLLKKAEGAAASMNRINLDRRCHGHYTAR